jgi:ATP-dependent Clp protease ATP-binding subunit ClpA
VISAASASRNKPGPMTDRATRVMVLANQEARRRESDSLETEDLLIALLREGHGVAARVLAAVGLSAPGATTPGEADQAPARPRPSLLVADPARQVVVLAAAEAGEGRIDTEHLLLGLLQVDSDLASRIYTAGGTDYARLRAEILERAKGKPGTLPDLAAVDEALNPVEADLQQAIRHGDTDAFHRLMAERDQLVVARHELLTAWVADLDAYAALHIVREFRALHSEIDRLRALVERSGINPDPTNEDEP